MSMRSIAKIVIAAALVVGCGSREPSVVGFTSRSMSGAARLDTEFLARPGSDRREVLIHVLWVPEFDLSGSHGTAGGFAGGEKLRTLAYTYDDADRTIRAQRVTVRDNAFVDGGGRTYPLSRGNVFLAQVSEKGAVRLTQVSSTLTAADPVRVLRAIQKAVDDPRVDAVRL